MPSQAASVPPAAHANTGKTAYDVAIVGAGVVGCAIARSFAIRGWKAIVLEKGGDILEGASKGNSALLHTGFDEPAGSAELKLIKAGCATYRRIHWRMNLPLVETAALVVAWDEEQLARLDGIAAHADANGVAASVVGQAALRRREPFLSLKALGAVDVPEEAIIDPWSAPLGYIRQAMMHGAELLTGAQVTGLSRKQGVWRVETARGEVAARLVVNAAGLFGDYIELLAGRLPGFTIKPRKGQFVVYDKPAHDLVNAIILRVPTERTKGVLLTRTVFGNLLLGPTAEDQDDRIHAACEEAVLRRIIAEGEAMLPDLAGQTITATFAALRPATEHRDYVLKVDAENGWITVGGIRSTGLSASLGIGEWVAGQGSDVLGETREAPSDDDLDWPKMPAISEALPRPYRQPDRSPIVCHCEWVTEREVEAALAGLAPAGTLGGLKRRTRIAMGRCQGFGCSGALARLAPHLLDTAAADVAA
ncbi:NAD(P)/FAD-dependent oxidoreductase [Mesorhizobium sp. LHD-90]|uniref:NAD(P)/FAD-dependent oxidoreductase n=1 Tax=Mesorhizobium sp. LHD-90 TaxID=3071414 RepID=UPI0027E07E0B|nr:NAD(P)/FAD-dependent oxidoreductase [Mesorhizobium sp. LHD-90]MDQ6435335.1 NAD(P)/FAD-dependent oxidoreductase [Mesorhizobium sp. LHD-90]